MFGFPKNPTDGMIFEPVPGLFYQFDKKNDCWVRVDGLEALGLATPTKDGLMSPEDLRKLNGLIIPPPQSTLKGEECKTTFTQGKVRLTSTDASLSVSPNLQLLNKRGTVGLTQPWFLHENTAGYDFKLNVDLLVAALKAAGHYTQVQIQGRQGMKGEPGDPGIDKLDTGPKGADGTPGKNSPFTGVISPEPNGLELADDNANRAIVDIQAVSGPDGNFLVATRANIGNPGACPQEVVPKDISSPQVVVLNKKENALVRTLEQTNDCNNPCTVCVTSLHHINMDVLFATIFERFVEQVIALKAAKEELAITWLQSLIAVFNEQKSALCCALENCKSTARNANDRRYIEQMRIQAAQADQQLIIDGEGDRKTINMDPDKSCPTGVVDANVRRGVGCDCVLEFTLDGKAHSTDPRGLFLERPVAIVDTRINNAFQTRQEGILEVHAEMVSDSEDPNAQVTTTRTISVKTGLNPPAEIGSIPRDSWALKIDNFSLIVNPFHTGKVNVTINIGHPIALGPVWVFKGSIDLAQLSKQTVSIPIFEFNPQNGTTDQTMPLTMDIILDTVIPFASTDPSIFVAADYTLGAINLSGSNTQFHIDLALQSNWNSSDWVADESTTGGGTTEQGSGRGFVQLSLPAGEYVAEITDCCVDMTNTRHVWQGTAAIEFNAIADITAAGGTEAPDPNFTQRETVLFPDLGEFNNNADARVQYLGSTVRFTHQGGQIRAWVVDPDGIAINNDGRLTICIKSAACVDDIAGSVPVDSGAIFVYNGSINPLNLIGIMHPFTGDVDAITNYGYGQVTADAEDIKFGPKRSLLTTKCFFYDGPDGLSFFTIHGGTNQEVDNEIKMSFGVVGNKDLTSVLVADDPSEVISPENDFYYADWIIGAGKSDGMAIGHLDRPTTGGAWALTVTANDLGLNQLWEAVGADGNRFALYVNPTGIHKIKAEQQVIFTPIKAGCVMSYKQIQWLERGHRTGASCSAVVNIDGTQYIIVKRSLADDTTCGGGESLSNPCIAQYIAIGNGHPAIAWPTFNGQEFLGIPTSGGHGFMFDQTFSDKVLAKLAAGDFTQVTGDPVNNIPFVLVATA